MIRFREWQVRRRLGHQGLIIDANMHHVRLEAKDSVRQRRLIALAGMRYLPKAVHWAARRLVWELGDFTFDDGDITPRPIEDSAVYKRMEDIWLNAHNPTKSRTYVEIGESIANTGRFRHKNYEITDTAHALGLIEACYMDLLRSMSNTGYIADKTSSFATAGIGLVLIGKTGELISGPAATHRKAAARIAQMHDAFPLRVSGVHRGWLSSNGIYKPSHLQKLPACLAQLDGVVAARGL